MGVLIGGAAVYLGLADRVAPLGTSVPRGVQGSAEAEPKPERNPAVVPPQPAAAKPPTLVDAVALTRDAVVNLETRRSLGAGVIVDPHGIVLTNYHVIADELAVPKRSGFPFMGDSEPPQPQIVAKFADDRRVPAAVLVADPQEDLAVLRLLPDDAEERFAAAQLGRSSELRIGQEVFAVGNPLRYEHTVSSGIVSAVGRMGILDNKQVGMIQLDASINLGNSGGPLFNLDGAVVGIVTARREQAQGIAFALPVDHVQGFLQAVSDPQAGRSGVIGVRLAMRSELPPTVAHLGYEAGLLLASVVAGGPADEAGLKEGDVIVSLRGKRLDGVEGQKTAGALAAHLQSIVRSMFSGEKLAVGVVRGADEVEIEIEIRTASRRDQAFIDAEEVLGLILEPKTEPPTIAGVHPSSPLARHTVHLRGQQVVSLMGVPTKNIEALGIQLGELREATGDKSRSPLVFLKVRDTAGKERWLPIAVR